MNKITHLLPLLFFTALCVSAQNMKKSMQYIRDENFEKAAEGIHKKLKKTPNDIAANYALSQWFFHKQNPQYQVDSSKKYLQKTSDMLASASPKELKKLQKLDITEDRLKHYNKKIDSTGFALASKINTEQGYQRFLDIYAGAPQCSLAAERRNAIAFAAAVEQNTYESYHEFMDKYPDAQQARNAKEIYDFMLFESKTSSGQLSDLEVFVRSYPRNPYKSRAEQAIYDIYTQPHTPEHYQNFLLIHSGSSFAKKAKGWLKLLQQNRVQTVYPFIEKGQYGFQNDAGQTLLPAHFDSIPEDYRCTGITADFVTVFKKGKSAAVNLENQQICPYKFQSVSALAKGLLLTQRNNLYGVWHYDGYELLAPQFQKIDTLNARLLVVTKGALKGLYSMQGYPLIMPSYDDIGWEGDRIIFKKKHRMDFCSEAQLWATRQKQPLNLRFPYDDIYESHGKFLIVRTGGYYGLLNPNGELIVPLHASNIEETRWGWTVTQNGKYYWLDVQGKPPNKEIYEQAITGQAFNLVKQNGKWGVCYPSGNIYRTPDLDSAKMLSPQIIWGKIGNKQWVSFGNGQWQDFSGFVRTEVLSNLQTWPQKSYHWLTAQENNGRYTLFGSTGKVISKGKFDKISLIGKYYFSVTQGSLAGICDTNGKLLQSLQYDGIGNPIGNNINTLKSGKFGLYNPVADVRIPPLYNASIVPYQHNSTRYIAIANNGKYGLLDAQNKPIISFVYDEIRFWQANMAMVRLDRKWYFFDIKAKKLLQESSFESPMMVWQNGNKQIMKIRKKNIDLLWSNQHDKPIVFSAPEIRNMAEKTSEKAFFFGAALQNLAYKIVYFDAEGTVLREQLLSETDYDRIVCGGTTVAE